MLGIFIKLLLINVYNRADKNSDSGQFGSGLIGHSDKDFILGLCPDYKSDTLTRPGPEPECPMSRSVVRMSEFVI